MASLRVASGFRFLQSLGAGSAVNVGSTTIPTTSTGVVTQLTSSLGGVVTFSKVSGSSNVTVSSAGAVTLASAIAAGDTNTFIARSQNDQGDAVERSITLRGVALPVAPVLGALTVAANAATIGSAFNTTVNGKTANSVLSLGGAGAAGLAVSGNTISGTPSAAGPINLIETLAGATNSPRTTSGLITVSTPAVTLTALTISPNTGAVGANYTGTITGKTSGSTLSLTGVGSSGLSISGSVITGVPTTSGSVDIVETLSGATNSPRTTSNLMSFSDTNLLEDPVMYQIGASLEGQGLRGSNSPVAYGFTAQSPLVWANHLAPKRLFTIITGKSSSDPYYARPSSYATGGAKYTSVPNPGWSVNDQVDLAVANAKTLPLGRKRVVWYSGGRNDMTVASTYMSREIANIDKLAAVFDLIIVPGLWKRHFAAADGWQSGGSNRTYTDQINAQFPAQLASRYGSKVVYVPLQDIMSDGTADQNPRLDYLCDNETHYSNLGAQACGKAVYNAIKGKFSGVVDSNNLISVTGTGGTLNNGVTGVIPSGFSAVKDPTIAVAYSIPSPGQVSVAVTTAVTQATVAEGTTLTGPAVTVTNAGNYRARLHVRIEPTTARIVIGGGVLDNTSGQRSVGMFACRANAYAAVNITSTATASIDTLDATNGLDLYIDTPDVAVTANSSLSPYVQIAVDQGAVTTVNVTTSEWSLVRGADSLPVFGFSSPMISQPEGNTGQNTLYAFEVVRSTSTGTVTIPYSINVGTMTGGDFTGGSVPANGSVIFAAGETSKFINVSIAGNNVEESAKTFTITLENPAGYVSNGTLTATGVVRNDDGAQSFAMQDLFTETTAKSLTDHISNTGHSWTQTSTYGMTISPSNNRVRWDRGTGYMRSSYTPVSANFDLMVDIRFVALRASGVAIRMGTDGACVTVGYSASGASWACNDRTASNSLSGYPAGSAVTIELNRWYSMIVKVRGNTFEQWIDGVQVSPTHTFRTNYGSAVGLSNVASYSTNGTQGMEYSNMRVVEY